jgi:5-methylcytosine-specific restriction endonuclease McrA
VSVRTAASALTAIGGGSGRLSSSVTATSVRFGVRDAGDGADEVDHIVPIGAGGLLYDEGNCRAVCGACNRARANRQRQRSAPPTGIGESLEACA